MSHFFIKLLVFILPEILIWLHCGMIGGNIFEVAFWAQFTLLLSSTFLIDLANLYFLLLAKINSFVTLNFFFFKYSIYCFLLAARHRNILANLSLMIFIIRITNNSFDIILSLIGFSETKLQM